MIIKLAVIALVIVAGFFFIKAANYTPFIPDSIPKTGEAMDIAHQPLVQVLFGLEPTQFGFFGVLAAASVVFFAYIGFDIVATAAEETKNPQRDIPRGILGSLILCTILYMLVSVVITGMVNYTDDALNTADPLAAAFEAVGATWIAKLIALGGVCGITSVILVLLLGQSRVLFAMARDGLLPAKLAAVHPKFGTPWLITVVTSAVVAILAGFVPLSKLSELVSIGTLFAFVVVCVGVIILRKTRPDLKRAFKSPGVPILPILAVAACVWLMLNLPVDTWVRFLIWMGAGFLVYFVYGKSHSRVRAAALKEEQSRR